MSLQSLMNNLGQFKEVKMVERHPTRFSSQEENNSQLNLKTCINCGKDLTQLDSTVSSEVHGWFGVRVFGNFCSLSCSDAYWQAIKIKEKL
jgi:hypothetical protein